MDIEFKKYKRFFAFGCSMTGYWWPTWADIIATEIPESYNYGRSGAGNTYISSMIAEANMRHCFTKDDLIIVMWSTITREDRYINKTWVTMGNIFNQHFYDDDFLKKYVDPRGQLIRDMSSITLTHGFLNNIGCDFHMLAMQQIDYVLRDEYNKLDGEFSDVIDLYTPTITKILPDLLTAGCGGNWRITPITHRDNNNQQVDHHPTPELHLIYLHKVFPNIKLGPNAYALVDKYEQEIKDNQHVENLSWKNNHSRTIL